MRNARASLFWKVWFVTNAFACTLAVAMDTPAQQGLPPFSSSSSVLMLQRIPGHSPATTASVQGVVRDETGRAVPGVTISASRAGVAVRSVMSNSEGIFRMLDLPLGTYQFQAGRDGFSPEALSGVQLTSGELLTLEVRLQASGAATPSYKLAMGLPGTSGTEMSEPPLISSYPTPYRR